MNGDLSGAYFTTVLFYLREIGERQDLSLSILVLIHIGRSTVGVIRVWS